MAGRNVVPSLARASQDIAGPLPPSLLRTWAASERTVEAALALLAPFARSGTVLCSDAAGLSRMSMERDLLDVLALISAPKEIVHAVATEAGGNPIGTWIADNTETLFPASVAIDDVLDAAWEIQTKVAAGGLVQIGISIHAGTFYDISGGLYGSDADVVELLAEEHAAGGETLVTRAVADAVDGREPYHFILRDDLSWFHAPGIYAMDRARGAPHLACADRNYPHPFTDAFVEALHAYGQAEEWGPARERLYQERQVERGVLFIARRPGARGAPNLAVMLDELATDVWMDMAVWQAVPAKQSIIEQGGGNAILAFASVRDAIDSALALRSMFVEEEVDACFGIDFGPVLLFEDGHGGYKRIAGGPVNIGSKLAEDVGEPGQIRITDRALERTSGLPPHQRFEVTVSRVHLTGAVL